MRCVIFFLLFCSVFSASAAEPWPSVQFAEVRAYAWPSDGNTIAVILPGMTLKNGALDKNGAILTTAQVDRLLSATRGTHSDHAIAMCHIPHNAFVFYDASHVPVGFVEICFTCLSTRVEPAGAAPFPDLLALAEIFAEHQLPMGEYPDLETFRRHYNEIDEMFHKKVSVGSGRTGS